jgi:hypothetical protein
MTIILYSNQSIEENAICTILSLKNKLKNDVRVVYYTIGFDSNFKHKNVITHRVEKNDYYPLYNFYKMDLCLKTIELYNDDYYFYTDIDVIFSKKVDFDKLKFDYDFPMASYGPVEFPITFRVKENGETEVYNERLLMDYYGVKDRSMRYVWNCIFSFNDSCKDFFQEVTDIFKNKELILDYKRYFPYSDETAFNVCLWKRGITKNLEQAFLNTIKIENLIKTEENELINYGFNSFDSGGFDWEHVNDSKKIIAYHGFKKLDDMKKCVEYVTEKNIIVVGCFITNEFKKRVLINFLNQVKKTGCEIVLVSHISVDEDILNLVDYFIYDKENEKLPKENVPLIWFADSQEYINIYSAFHGLAISKNVYNALKLFQDTDYRYFIYIEFDYILHDSDVYNLSNIFTRLKTENKKLYFNKSTELGGYSGNLCQTQMFAGEINYYMKNINLPKTYNEWVSETVNFGSNSLEKVMTIITDNHKDKTIYGPQTSELLPDSNTDVFSSFDSNIIAYNLDEPNYAIVYIIPRDPNYTYKLLVNDDVILDSKLTQIFKYKLSLNETDTYVSLYLNGENVFNKKINIFNIKFYRDKAVKKSFIN